MRNVKSRTVILGVALAAALALAAAPPAQADPTSGTPGGHQANETGKPQATETGSA